LDFLGLIPGRNKMDGWTDRQGRWMGRLIDGSMDGWVGGQTDRQTGRWMGGQTGRWMDGCTDRQTDR
jgi:hypothetical protein